MSWREWLGMRPRLPDFAQALVHRVDADATAGWQFLASESALKNHDDCVVNLQNLFLEYSRASRQERPALFEKYVSFIEGMGRQIPALWTMAERGVYAVLRSRYDLIGPLIAARHGKSSAPQLLAWPWVAELEIRIVFDHGQHIVHVTREQAQVWGQSDAQLQACAIANLRSLPTPVWTRDGPVCMLESVGGYTESLMLLDDVLSTLPFAGTVACMAPNRGILLAVDARVESDVQAMLAMATRCAREQPWPLAWSVFTRTATGWVTLEMPAAARPLAADLKRLSWHNIYAEQQSALQTAFETSGTDIYVATYALIQRGEDAPVQSWCTWVEGVESTLPQTDLVAFAFEDDRGPLMVPWEIVMSHVGALLVAQDEAPVRFSVSAFPSTDRIDAMREASGAR